MNTKRIPLLVGIVLLVALAFVGVASACTEGCTPGYWKNNYPGAWPVPNNPLGVNLNGDSQPDTYLDALNYKGGTGVEGAERILLRAFVAAYLNSMALPGYEPTPVVNEIFTSALDSGDRQTMLDAAAQLDAWNNVGCPLRAVKK